MANVVVVGAQWGDEGKGKVVDWLSERADVVIRYQGGHNAGHTLVIDGVSYKLSLLPSGVVRGKMSVIGNGVVLDPHHFVAEIAKLKAQNVHVTPDNLMIAENTSLILSLHRDLDAFREEASAEGTKIGTTRRGIGPAYEDKVGRRAIRVIDLAEPETLKSKIARLLAHHNAIRRGMQQAEFKVDEVYDELMAVAADILPFCGRAWDKLAEYRRKGKRLLFEGAQGALLDNDFGTYPFVTSSNTVAAQASIGSGVGLSGIQYVLGIAKAYTTRVGEGPFPTELNDDTGHALGVKGHEFGTVTGRKRRCGWFDAVLVRQMVTVSGINGLALTKLDVLDDFDEIKICTGYKLDGKVINYFPSSMGAASKVEPIYESFAGWKAETRGARTWSALPSQAIKYVRYIEELVGVPVSLLSTSPERDDTVLVKDPFED